jgi:biotin synthase
MEMFQLLGLEPMKPFVKKEQPVSVEAQYSKYKDQGEKPRWTRPEHTINRNEEAKSKAKMNTTIK